MGRIARMKFIKAIDWTLLGAVLPLLGAGLVTMGSFTEGGTDFLAKQLLWIGIALTVFFLFALVDVRFFRKTSVVVALYLFGVGLLLLVVFLGITVKGAQSWLDLGGFSLQPSDPMKLILIIILAKYFSRRHIAIADPKHILISGGYMFLAFALVFFQPDFGSAIILFLIWFGMILVTGISKKHLFIMLGLGVIVVGIFWGFVFEDYQKDRILTFLHPLEDVRGSGYNAYQSTIAVGSGQLFGKGLGYGTQSRLKFLPEYQTDFVFAAFAEEWGFLGAILVLFLFGIVIWRILKNGMIGSSNFESLFALGVAIFLMSHIVVNVGMNVGLMPVTGITLPFMSYGGSHLLTEFAALGILMSMRRYARFSHRDTLKQEIIELS